MDDEWRVRARNLIYSVEVSLTELRQTKEFWRLLSSSYRQQFEFFMDDLKSYKESLK